MVTPEIRAYLEREISRCDRRVRFPVSGDMAVRRDRDEKSSGGGRVSWIENPPVKSGIRYEKIRSKRDDSHAR